MVHSKLIFNCVENAVDEWSYRLAISILLELCKMVFARLDDKNEVEELFILLLLNLNLVKWSDMLQALNRGPLLSRHQCDIVYLLFSYCFGVQ